MRAFVTGGSGFLGSRLIRACAGRGDKTVALVRSQSAEEAATKAGAAETVRGDLDSVDVMARAMEGCDAVFHCAALVKDWGDPEEFHRVNVGGTENVLTAAKRAKVPRVVHVSTEAVLLDGKPIQGADESTPRPKKPLGLYPLTKSKAEDAVLAAAKEGGIEAVIVRPRFIWGPEDTTVLPLLIETVKSGVFRWIGGGHHLTSTCYVDNVVEGMLLALERGRSGEVYFLTDGEPVEMRAFVSTLLETAGVTPPATSVPRWLVKAVAWSVEGVWQSFSISKPPPLTRAAVCLIGQEVTVSDRKARKELGYRAKVGFEEGLAAMRKYFAARQA